MRKFFRDCNLVIHNYRNNTPTATLAVVFVMQCLVSNLAMAVGALAPLSFLPVTCVILGILGLALTLYVHRPNSNRPDIWG